MQLRLWRQRPKTQPRIHRGENSGILFQNHGLDGSALWYIDQGWRNAMTACRHRWAEWNHHQSVDQLFQTINRLKPSLLLLNLHTIERRPSPWTQPSALRQLLELKQRLGFQVACRSNPSNIADLFLDTPIDFDQFRENVSSFYLQADHPTAEEKPVFESGLIDLIRTAFHRGTFSVAFRNYLDLGCKVLEEPHAADLIAYPPGPLSDNTVKHTDDFDILFVGGCWPFKWANMEPYVWAMKKRFGYRFRIHGTGWPDDIAHDRLPEARFNAVIQSAKINLTLHEISQTLPDPFSGNERIFKLGALGCCTLSDANPLIGYHFDVDREVPYCESADAMVSKTEELLDNPDQRDRLSQAHQQRVIGEHSYQVRLQRIFSALEATESIVSYRAQATESRKTAQRDAA